MKVQTKRKLWGAGIGVGLLLCLAPVAGLLGTVMGMTKAFETLGNAGVQDPEGLSKAIGTTLESTAWGLFLGGFGFVLLIVSVISLILIRKEPASTTPAPPLPQPE